MGRVKLAIFDLDGTLLVMQMNGLPQHTTDEYRQMVGRGILRLVEAAVPEQMRSPEYVEKVRRDFVAYYLDHIDLHTHPYNGIPELINAMTERGVKIAVASNKFQAGTERLIRSLFPGVEFVAVLGQRVPSNQYLLVSRSANRPRNNRGCRHRAERNAPHWRLGSRYADRSCCRGACSRSDLGISLT